MIFTTPEKKPNMWKQFDKIGLDHIQDEFHSAESYMAAGIRSKSRIQKSTYLRQVKQSLLFVRESLQYFENILEALM